MYMENPAQMDMVALIAMGLDQHRNTSVAVPSLGNYPIVTMKISLPNVTKSPT